MSLVPVQCAIEPCLEVLKLPCLCEGPPDEAGGVGRGPVHAAGNTGTIRTKAIKRMVIEAHEPGGTSLDTNGTPAPTKGTASVELAGGAEGTTTAKPEALEPWAESEAWRGFETMPPPPQKGSGEPGSLP